MTRRTRSNAVQEARHRVGREEPRRRASPRWPLPPTICRRRSAVHRQGSRPRSASATRRHIRPIRLLSPVRSVVLSGASHTWFATTAAKAGERPRAAEAIGPAVRGRVDLAQRPGLETAPPRGRRAGRSAPAARTGRASRHEASSVWRAGARDRPLRLDERARHQEPLEPQLAEEVRKRRLVAEGDVHVPRDLAVAGRRGSDRFQNRIVLLEECRERGRRDADPLVDALQLPIEEAGDRGADRRVGVHCLGGRMVVLLLSLLLGPGEVDPEDRGEPSSSSAAALVVVVGYMASNAARSRRAPAERRPPRGVPEWRDPRATRSKGGASRVELEARADQGLSGRFGIGVLDENVVGVVRRDREDGDSRRRERRNDGRQDAGRLERNRAGEAERAPPRLDGRARRSRTLLANDRELLIGPCDRKKASRRGKPAGTASRDRGGRRQTGPRAT